MDALILTINRLQEVFSTCGTGSSVIQLPQIVVIGSQSCGKSSVLESLVGRSFLPRGSGVVTRCPIVLQMIHVSSNDKDSYSYSEIKANLGVAMDVGEWCHFVKSDEAFTDWDQVRREIQRQTDEKAGSNKGISLDEIILRVYSPNVVDLTLVDLPGFVKVSVGDQPEDIEMQVDNMVRNYVKNKKSIILAVSAANNDVANSESLKMAKEMDPEGERTIAVFTKLDMMDRGTNATDVLSGKTVPVKLGIIGVVNRGQMDIDMPISEALKKEAEFFNRHYPAMSTNGTPYLAKKAHELLLQHIAVYLPPLAEEVNERLIETEKELKKLGGSIANKNAVLAELLVNFDKAYSASLGAKARNFETKQLSGGAKINQILNEIFPQKLNLIDPSTKVTDKEILITSRNVRGSESRSIVFEEVCQNLAKGHVHHLHPPVADCAERVDIEMKRMIQDCLPNEMLRFPKLKDAIAQVLSEMLRSRQEKAKDILQICVDIQTSFVTTMDNDELRALEKTAMEIMKFPIPGHIAPVREASDDPLALRLRALCDLEESEERPEVKYCIVVRQALTAYFKTITASIQDYVPKFLDHTVVKDTESNLLTTLLNNLNTNENAETLLAESEEIAEKRRTTNKNYIRLLNAKKILQEFNFQ